MIRGHRGINRDRPADQFDRHVGTADLCGQNAQQMERTRHDRETEPGSGDRFPRRPPTGRPGDAPGRSEVPGRLSLTVVSGKLFGLHFFYSFRQSSVQSVGPGAGDVPWPIRYNRQCRKPMTGGEVSATGGRLNERWRRGRFCHDQKTRRARLERVVLLTLAAVQFTSIVDFMVVIPLGPQLKESLGLNPQPVRPGRLLLHLCRGDCGCGRFAAGRSHRTQAGVPHDLHGVPGRHAPVRPGSDLRTLVAARVATGAFGGILGGMAMAIIGDVFPEERRGRATGR